MTAKLVLSNMALADESVLVRDAHAIGQAARVFRLTLPEPGLASAKRVFALRDRLMLCELNNAYEFYMCFDEDTDAFDRYALRDWRKLADGLSFVGLSDAAQAATDYRELGQSMTRDEAIPCEENTHIARSAELQARLDGLQSAWDRATAGLDQAAIDDLLIGKYNLHLVDETTFDAFWVDTIMSSPTFGDADAIRHAWQSESAAITLYEEVELALARNGYSVQFVFWARELESDFGRRRMVTSRGYVYAQTTRGPIRVLDHTDPVKFGMDYPVEVQRIDGTPLFRIDATDVPGRDR